MNECKVNSHFGEVYLDLKEMIQACTIDMILKTNREILEILGKVCAQFICDNIFTIQFMLEFTLEALLKYLELALSACSKLYSRNSTFTINIQILQLLKGTAYKGSKLKIAMCGFNDDYY